MRFPVCLFFFFSVCQTFASSLSLKELYSANQITISAKGKGGFSGEVLEIRIKNVSKTVISGYVEPGATFRCADENAQNLIVLAHYPFELKPSETALVLAYTNCIEPSDYSPHADAAFSYEPNPNEKLAGLAKVIATQSAYLAYSQSLLWSLARKEKSFTYTTEDSIQAWPVFQYIATVAQLNKYIAPKPPKPKFMFSTRINLVYSMETDQKLSLLLTDANGKLIREYYKNKTIPRGIYTVTLGHNDMVEDTTQRIVYKLVDETGKEVLKRVVKNNTLEDKLRFWELKTILEYSVKEPVASASLQLFDPEGNLVSVLYQNKNLPAGTRRSPFSFFHGWGSKAIFTLKLFDNKNKVILEFPLDAKTSTEVKMK